MIVCYKLNGNEGNKISINIKATWDIFKRMEELTIKAWENHKVISSNKSK